MLGAQMVCAQQYYNAPAARGFAPEIKRQRRTWSLRGHFQIKEMALNLGGH